ncbi:MAG TPA: ABC transporter permease [Polyangiaceae bacterium]|nr:ABC transporter permease [Polyangiaceae bacterium]
MIPISYNVRSLFVRKATTIATALGIALVVFVLASSLMLSAGIERTMGRSGSPSNAIVLRKGSDAELSSNFESRLVSLILAAPGVKKDETGAPLGAGEVMVVVALEKIGDEPGRVSNVQVRGVTDNVLKVRPEARVIVGRAPKPGSDEAMIGKSIRGRFAGVDLDSSFELKKNRRVKVVGVFEAQGSSSESEIWTDIDTLRNSLGREGLVSSVTARLESDSKATFDAFSATVQNDKQLGLEALRQSTYFEKSSENTAVFISALGISITVIFSLGAIIGAVITMYAAVAQRQREIGTLRALGFSRLTILSSFLLESVVLALVGGVVGGLAALCMSFVRFSMMNFATWSEIVFSFEPTVPIIVTSIVVGAVMGVLGGVFPAVRAARVSPIDAMRA